MQTRLDIDENEFRLEGVMFWTIQNKSELVQVAVFVREMKTGIISSNVNIKPGHAKQSFSSIFQSPIYVDISTAICILIRP